MLGEARKWEHIQASPIKSWQFSESCAWCCYSRLLPRFYYADMYTEIDMGGHLILDQIFFKKK